MKKYSFSKSFLVLIISLLFSLAGCNTASTPEVKHDHTWDSGKVVTEKTCTTDGKKVYTCTICGETKDEAIAKGHELDDGAVAVEPTCSAAGSKKFSCKKCSYTESREIAKIDHTWNDGEETVLHTCTTEGTKTYTCTVCSTTKEEKVDAAHTWEDVDIIQQKTCTADGKKKIKCSACNEESEVIIPASHSYNDGVVTTQPTCTAEGVKTFTCSKCNGTKTEPVAKIAHAWDSGNITTVATCTTNGIRTFTCSGCSGTRTEVVAATGHNEEEVASETTSTCFTKGVAKYKCTRCSTVLRTVENAPELYTSPIDAETNGKVTSTTKYVYFGVYPQTEIQNHGTLDSNSTIKGWHYYYKNSVGEWYEKYNRGGDHYYKVEPIKWKILTRNYNNTGKALLLADKILYDEYYLQDTSTSQRTINGESNINYTDYQYSTVRGNLIGKKEVGDPQTTIYENYGFLQLAFMGDSQSRMQEVDGDKVFLLSKDDLKSTSYGFNSSENENDNARKRIPTDYAEIVGAVKDSDGYGKWWLKSGPNFKWVEQGYVKDNQIDNNYSDRHRGVVPAIVIDLN